MADACIVCLGELAAGGSQTPSTDSITENHGDPASAKLDYNTSPSHDGASSLDPQTEVIAHLLPCGHNLHDDCLKPWVERANSCPICRQQFNQVELRYALDGPCISSYAVQDKQQVADVDASLVIEDETGDDFPNSPCLLCCQHGDEEVLLLCDGCNGPCHTYCVDLSSVPAGSWYCPFCQEEGLDLEGISRRSRYRTRYEQSHHRGEQSPNAWARVWQSVWDRLDIDLDFPFDEDAVDLEAQRGELHRRNRREFVQWRHRFNVAERQGGAARFRDTASTLLDSRRNQDPNSIPQEESREELRAWNAFDKAKELRSQDAVYARKKRKSPSSSPSEPVNVPERKLKRPRTRRAPSTSDTPAEISASSTIPPMSKINTSTDSPKHHPSFFQSLLKEVESTTNNGDGSLRSSLRRLSPSRNMPDSTSSSHHSPLSSPGTSELNSPRGRSPSPSASKVSRPTSPPPLTSRIEPLSSPVIRDISKPLHNGHSEADSESPGNASRSRIKQSESGSSKRRDSAAGDAQRTSPTNPSMSFSAKSEIQEIVKAALKPAYKNREIETHQYTEINREVSRRLYNKIGEAGGLHGSIGREKWQSIAADEVKAAVKKRQSHPTEPST